MAEASKKGNHRQGGIHLTEKDLSRLIHTTSEAVLLVDENGVALFATPAAEALLGRNEITGKPVSLEGWLDGFPGVWENNLEGSGAKSVPFAESPRKMQRWQVQWQGKLAHMVILQPSLPAANQVPSPLLDTDSCLIEQVLKAVPFAYYYQDTVGVILGCNQEYAALVETPLEKIIGFSPVSYLSPNVASAHEFMNEELLHEGGKRSYPIKIRRTDGGDSNLVMNKARFMGADGSVGGIVGVLIDATDRKRQDVIERASDAHVQHLLGSTPAVVFSQLAAQNLRITYVSDNINQLLGYSVEEVLEEADFFLTHLHAEDREVLQAGLPELFQNGCRCRDYRLRHRDGSYRWLRDEVRVVYDAEGSPTEILGSWVDISDSKKAREDLQRHDAILNAVNLAAETFLRSQAGDWEDNIVSVLENLANAADVSVATIFEYKMREDGTRHAVFRYDWRWSKTENKLERPQLIAVVESDAFKDWDARLERGEVIYGETESFQPVEREALRIQGILSIAEIPIFVENQLWGSIGFSDHKNPRQWSDVEIESLRTAANMLGAAIQRTRMEEALRAQESQYRLLTDSILDVIALLDFKGKITYVSPSVNRIVNWDAEELMGKSGLPLIHPEDNRLVANQINSTLKKKGESLFEWRCKKKEGGYVWIETRLQLLRDDQGKPIGLLTLSRDISERKQTLFELTNLNKQLENSLDELRQRHHETRLLNEMGDMFQSCLTQEELFNVVAQFSQKLFPNMAGALYVQDQGKKLLESVAIWGDNFQGETIFVHDSCWSLRRGQPFLYGKENSRLRCQHLGLHTDQLAKPYLCIPMNAQGETLGVYHLQGESSQSMAQMELLAVTLAEHTAMALANLRLRETLRMQSIHDPLTGLYNRRYLDETLVRELHAATRRQDSLGIVMMDIDHFKHYNDEFGHEAGDLVLRALGSFLRRHVRVGDIACRLGGEEFVLIMPDTSLNDAMRRAEEIRRGVKVLNVPYHGKTLGAITVSVGVAGFPAHGTTAEVLMRTADAALYQAKRKGRDRVTMAT